MWWWRVMRDGLFFTDPSICFAPRRYDATFRTIGRQAFACGIFRSTAFLLFQSLRRSVVARPGSDFSGHGALAPHSA